VPKKLHRQLAKQASKKSIKGAQRRKYIYGAMKKTGWKPKRERG